MTTVIDQNTTAPNTDASDADEPEPLQVHLPEKWQLQAWQVGLVVACSLFFMYHNYMRLFYSDVWGHIAYGNWILDHQELPTSEPFVPLAEGVEVTATAWGGQILLALAGRGGGAEGYSALFAVVTTLTYAVYALAFRMQIGRFGWACLASFLVWAVNWGRHAVIRPEMFGGLCFAILIACLIAADPRRKRDADDTSRTDNGQTPWFVWLAVPLVMTLWANLHGSFVVGLVLLGCYTVGRGIEVLLSTGNLWAIFADRTFRRWVILTELAVVAACINPYGFDLLLHTLLFPQNPNLKDIMEWYSLEMVSLEGITVGASWIITLVVLRHSRAALRATDVVAFSVFTLAVIMRVRMVAWYGPVWMLMLAPHLRDVLEQIAATKPVQKLRDDSAVLFTRSPHYTLIAALVLWLAFAFSPVSKFVLGGKARADSTLYHSDTPLAVTDYLRENPPSGLVAGPQWWGDWLAWDGPEGIQMMMTTNAVHVAPPQVWKDYLRIANATPDLSRRLDRYRVNTLIVHKELQTDLERSVRRLPGWRVTYEDDLALIAVRGGEKTAEPDFVPAIPSPAVAEKPEI
ncbi:hypothetical protein [Thalassoroseus pseudoceratinae]|uniref:hypothetical protein n=1 Tax=Thalassoroseus pseudoceratinae TaxID=2713176 RepID=UPI0014249C05|nr:hypothetical protein [Thalassoroseus pseudoceratinae]